MDSWIFESGPFTFQLSHFLYGPTACEKYACRSVRSGDDLLRANGQSLGRERRFDPVEGLLVIQCSRLPTSVTRPYGSSTRQRNARESGPQCSGRPAHVPDHRGNGGVRAGACLLALKKLGSAPFADILSEVFTQKTIKKEMDTAKACRWMIGDMVRKGLLEVKN
jgi:hypothetical protein